MKRPPRLLLVATAALCASTSLFVTPPAGVTDEPPPPDASKPADARVASARNHLDPRRFDQVKALLRRGAYAEARQALEALRASAPDDPQVQLYLALCERRLESLPPFTQLSPEQLKTLQQHLEQEEREQRRAAAVQRTLDRQIEREQATWDRDLEVARKQAERKLIQQQRLERVQEKQRAQQESVRRLQPEAQTAAPAAGEQPQREAVSPPPVPVMPPAAPSTTPPTAPRGGPETAPIAEAPAPAPPGAPASRGSERAVELAPVVVPAAAPETPVSPSLVGRTVPLKGAVQIHARQMSMSPDRRIAIADGDVEVVFENAVLTCDHLTLFTDTKDVYAEGRVRIEEGKQIFRGELAHYNFETKKGRFLQGTVSSPPWHEHGRAVEHIAEGVYEVTPGYLTTCELEPPHFRLAGRRAIVFADDRLARVRNVALIVEQVPFLYLPFLAIADRKMPFYIIPGKKKPWGPFALMGYRYVLPGPGQQQGTVKLDWRTNFGWGEGVDHQFDSPQLGKGLFKFYFNQDANRTKKEDELVKEANKHRYRVLWRHRWNPMPDTTVVTDIQKYSDIDFRKELLFREEFISDDVPESYVSVVTNDPNFTFTGLVKRRINRFQTVTNALPQLTFDVRPQQIGDTHFFSESKLDFANLETKRANSDNDTDAVRLDWFEQLKYAMNWFRPVEVTPRFGIRQTYFNKDRQGGDRQGDRHLFSGQWNTGVDTSLKLFRIFPVTSNVLGMNLHGLRHVLTPTISYDYIYRPTVLNDLLSFPVASAPTDRLTFGVENKLQTRRPDAAGKLRGVDLGRLLVSVPYTFRGNGNKQGGRLGDWTVDLETYPTSWMRVESDYTYNAVLPPGQDGRSSKLNLDLVIVGGRPNAEAKYAPGIQAPTYQAFQPGPQALTSLMPQGQWSLGLGHRFSRNDRTEDVLQWDWQLSEKWQIGTFHRFTWKEVANGSKRFNNLREYQYRLRRDLHDWFAELVYRVDREFGEELYFTLTLKAYPELPIGMQESYHQPKLGSQSSPFSPIRAN